jgi:hypothetical protein
VLLFIHKPPELHVFALRNKTRLNLHFDLLKALHDPGITGTCLSYHKVEENDASN